jgi:hypothetical protein
MTALGGVNSPAPAVTMEQIIEANSTEVLLAHYGSVHVASSDYEVYIEPGLIYRKADYGEEVITPDFCYELGYDGAYEGSLTVGSWWDFIGDQYDYFSLDPAESRLEEVVSTEGNGDTITVRTRIPVGVFEDEYSPFGGDYSIIHYVLDAETLAILENDEVVYYIDGSVANTYEYSQVAYGDPRPKAADALLRRIYDPDATRTVTLIANPGTEVEKISKAIMRKGEHAVIYSTDDKEWITYTDAACTQEYEGGSDLNEDITLYTKRAPLA